MSYWVAGAVTVSAGLNYMGQQQAGQAAGDGAMAQAHEAMRTREAVMGKSEEFRQISTSLSQASPQELNALGQSMTAAQKNLSQQQKLMDQIDPALMEASKQALDILRGGGNSAMNNSVLSLRNSQRAQLVNSLKAQYGPGAELSSIGQRALQQFDMQSNVLQQNTLGNLMNIATNPAPGQNLQRAISGLEEVGQGYSALKTRELNTQLNLGAQTLGALSGTSQAVINTAGAPYVGQALQGQAMSSLGNNAMQLGTMYAMNRNNNAATNPSGTSSPY